jgi:hypothetical protein
MGLRVAVFLVPNDWATDLQGKIVNNLQCDMCNQLKINTLILNINPYLLGQNTKTYAPKDLPLPYSFGIPWFISAHAR